MPIILKKDWKADKQVHTLVKELKYQNEKRENMQRKIEKNDNKTTI